MGVLKISVTRLYSSEVRSMVIEPLKFKILSNFIKILFYNINSNEVLTAAFNAELSMHSVII